MEYRMLIIAIVYLLWKIRQNLKMQKNVFLIYDTKNFTNF
jgi:hypothetical protein